MAELEFFFKQEENNKLVSYFFENGYKLITIHNDYKSPIPIIIANYQEFIEYDSQAGIFLLSHPDYSIYPPTFRSFKKDGEILFFIPQRYGGPFIEFYMPISYVEGSTLHFGAGFIGIYLFYYIDDMDERFYPKEELKKHYRNISSFIKKQTKVISCIPQRTFRISAEVIEALKAGSKLVGFSDEVIADFLKKIKTG